MPSWVSFSHSYADFPFLMLTILGQDITEFSSRVSCYCLMSQGWSLLLILTVCSRGQKHQERIGKDDGAAMKLERQSSVLNTDQPSVDGTLGCAPACERLISDRGTTAELVSCAGAEVPQRDDGSVP